MNPARVPGVNMKWKPRVHFKAPSGNSRTACGKRMDETAKCSDAIEQVDCKQCLKMHAAGT